MTTGRTVGALVALSLGLAASSCSSCGKTPATADHAAPAQAAAGATMPAFKSTQPDPGAPMLSASLGDQAGSEWYAGWPLIVVARVAHAPSDGSPSSPTVVMDSPAGDWPTALRPEITDPNGRKVDWPFHLATTSPGPLTLNEDTVGLVGWWLSPEETARIAAGDYRLVVRLDTTASTQGWKGAVVSETLPVHVRPAPATLSDAQASASAVRLADWHMLQDNNAAASADVDALLARRPHDAAALTLKGDLLMATGKADEAAATYDRALESVVAQQPNGAEPPMVLLRKRRAASAAAGK